MDATTQDVVTSNTSLVSTDEEARTQTYEIEAANTSTKAADYTVTVSTEPTLRAEGDSSESDQAAVVKNDIAVKGTTLPVTTPDDKTDDKSSDASDESTSAEENKSSQEAESNNESTDDASSKSGDSASHDAVTANLPVAVTFQKGGAEAGPYAITLQVQSRAQQWDASKSAWGEMSEWSDVAGKGVTLSSGDVLGAKDATYTFSGLEVQSNDADGQPVARTEYRVVETMLAGAQLTYDSTSDSVMSYTGDVTLDDVTCDVVAKVADTAVAKAVDTEKGSVEAQVQTAEITNELIERVDLFTGFLRTFGLLGASSTEDDESGEESGDSTSDNYPTATGDPVRTINVNDETEEVTVTFTYTIYNNTKNYDDYGQLAFILGGISKDYQVVIRDKNGNVWENEYNSYYGTHEFSVFNSVADTLTIEITVPENASEISPTIQFLRPSDTDNMTNRCENYANDTDYPLENGMTFYSQQAAQLVTSKKIWRDNAKSDKSIDGMALKLQYRDVPAEGQTSGDWNEGTYGPSLEIHQTAIANKLAGTPDTQTDSVWTYNFAKQLYTYTYTESGGWQELEYRLAETTVPSAYVASYDDDNDLVNTLKMPLTFTVSWQDDNNAYSTRLSQADLLTNLQISKGATSDATTTDVPFNTTDPDDEGYVKVTDNLDGTWTRYMPNALGYDANGNHIHYGLTTTSNPPDGATTSTPNRGGNINAASTDKSRENNEGDTTFNPQGSTVYTSLYTNADVYSSRQSALYTGGTLKLTLSNTAAFWFTKRWEDNNAGANARPNVKLVLYRYVEGSDYTTASPVPLVGTVVAGEGSVAKADGTISMDKDNTGNSITLPYFNDAGKRYVYFVKETLTADNSIMVSKLQGDSYVPARVRDNNGTTGDIATESSWSGLPYYDVTNGGILENRLTGTTDILATKKWVAAARQDVDAKVTFDLYRDGDKVENGSVTLSGFGAESTSGSFSYNEKKNGAGANSNAKLKLPKYDATGKAYTYDLKESKVETKVSGVYVEAAQYTVQENGTDVTYFLTDDGYRYKQTSNVTTESDGRKRVTVTNTLVGEAEIDIVKTFSDGFKDADKDKTVTLTFTIYRNDEEIGTKTVNVTESSLDENHKVTGDVANNLKITDYSQFDGSTTTGPLPRYDESGNEYTYTVKETNTGGYSSSNTSQKSETSISRTITDTITKSEKVLLVTSNESNSYKTGDPSISITKTWRDANETLYRQPVKYRVEIHAPGTEGNWYAMVPSTTGSGYTAVEVNESFNTTQHTSTISPNQEYVYLPITTAMLKTIPGIEIDSGSDKDASYWVNGTKTTGEGTEQATTETTNPKAWKKVGRPSEPTDDGIAIRIVEVAVDDDNVVEDNYVNNNDSTGENYHPEHKDDYDFVQTDNQNYDVEDPSYCY